MAQTDELPPGYEQTYRVEWLYASQPSLNAAEIQAELRQALPESLVEQVGTDGRDLSIVHKGHTVEFADGRGKAITAVFTARDRPISEAEFEGALQQTWTWPRDEARDKIRRSHARVVEMDLMSRGQPYGTRLALVHEVAKAIARVTRPEICYWHPAGWMVAPERLTNDPLDAAMNVRLFNVESRSGELVMDTLGLAAIGLPDIQCHFRGLEAGRVAGLLRSIGRYVFEKGDVIDDGHTVQGLEPSDKWKCRHELALVEPKRMVLDLNPQPPYSTH